MSCVQNMSERTLFSQNRIQDCDRPRWHLLCPSESHISTPRLHLLSLQPFPATEWDHYEAYTAAIIMQDKRTINVLVYCSIVKMAMHFTLDFTVQWNYTVCVNSVISSYHWLYMIVACMDWWNIAQDTSHYGNFVVALISGYKFHKVVPYTCIMFRLNQAMQKLQQYQNLCARTKTHLSILVCKIFFNTIIYSGGVVKALYGSNV